MMVYIRELDQIMVFEPFCYSREKRLRSLTLKKICCFKRFVFVLISRLDLISWLVFETVLGLDDVLWNSFEWCSLKRCSLKVISWLVFEQFWIRMWFFLFANLLLNTSLCFCLYKIFCWDDNYKPLNLW